MPWVQRPRPGIPSYETNFAGPDRLPPANPGLWPGLVFSWHGPLGVTGIDTDSIKDTSGRGNHGTPSGMDANDWSMTEKGWGLDLDGTNDHIVVSPKPHLNTAFVTIAAIASSDGAVDSDDVLQRLNTMAGTVFLRATATAWLFRIRTAGGTQLLTSDDAPTGGFQSLIATFDGSVMLLYVDGVLQSEQPALAGPIDTANFSKFYIGAHTNPTNYFDGTIVSVDVWDQALTSNKIQQLFVDPHAITRPMQRLFVGGGAAAPAGAIMKQLQGSNVGADLFNGSLI